MTDGQGCAYITLESAPELKPCPFCGSRAVIYEYNDVLGDHYIVECKSENGCFVKPKTEWLDTKGMAIEAWNRRGRQCG